MKNPAIISCIVASIFVIGCKRELNLTPPAGAKIISFTQNTHVKNRAIYQGQAEAAFKAGDASHTWWGGIVTPEPSLRLHAQLLSNVQEVYFTLTFLRSGKKVFSKLIDKKDLTGCTIPTQELKENEFVIEVIAPQGLKLAKDAEYRVFVGIEGDKPVKFHGAKGGK